MYRSKTDPGYLLIKQADGKGFLLLSKTNKLICGHCGKEVTETESGNITYSGLYGSVQVGKPVEVFLTHKSCDKEQPRLNMWRSINETDIVFNHDIFCTMVHMLPRREKVGRDYHARYHDTLERQLFMSQVV